MHRGAARENSNRRGRAPWAARAAQMRIRGPRRAAVDRPV